MSNRTLVELNHDFTPRRDRPDEVLAWAHKLINYLGSGDPRDLPQGVTFKHRRHHSEPCPYRALEAIAGGDGDPFEIARQTLPEREV